MIPILYPADAATFTTQGLGALSDAISCKVTEERNGVYELEMEYPMTGAHYADLAMRAIICAIPSPYRDKQPFRIYDITRPMDGVVTVYAQHISYDLSGVPVEPFTAPSLAAALSGLADHAAVSSPFTFWTDRASTVGWTLKVPTACRSCLGGVQGSILDTYGGEYAWDGYIVRLYSARGKNSGVTVRYGKNLTDISHKEAVTSTITGVLPYWYDDQSGTLVYAPVVSVSGAAYDRAIPLDLSQDFEAAPTVAQLTAAAQDYLAKDAATAPEISIDVSFVALDQMSGYEDLALLEKCDLCDTVTVEYAPLGVDVTAKVVSITTDVLLERYDSMTVGSIAPNVAQTIADQQRQLDEGVTSSMLDRAVQNATDLITGASGGYVILHQDDAGRPYEILIMDTDDIATATKVWRWNQAGWGYSSNGYNGPYTLAATMDGAIVADMITAGTMSANRISGGTLTMGGTDNGNGVIQVLDADGNEAGRLSNTGLSVTRGAVRSSGTISYNGESVAVEAELYGGAVTAKRANTGIYTETTAWGTTVFGPDVSVGGYRGMAQIYGVEGSPNYGVLQLGTATTPIVIKVRLEGNTGNGTFAGTVTQGSDRRLKSDIADIPADLVNALAQLAPKTYTLKADPGKRSIGLIAQDVQKTPLGPLLVVEQEDGLLTLDYTSLHGVEIAAIQRLQAEVAALRAEIAALKEEKYDS